MPLPSYTQLKRDLLACQQRCAKLSTDPDFGIYNRAALEFEVPRVQAEARFLVLITIPDFRDKGKIRKCLARKHAALLLRARWSFHEVIVILSDDPKGYIERMRTCFGNEHISASFAYVPFKEDVAGSILLCEAIINAHANGYEL